MRSSARSAIFAPLLICDLQPPMLLRIRDNVNGQAQKRACNMKRAWEAGNGTRTRDLLLGKQSLYRLSYTRVWQIV